MATARCPHCGEKLSAVRDAFCPYCRESLDELNSAMDPALEPARETPPGGCITVETSDEFPKLCVICGSDAQLSVRFRFHREHSVKKSLLKRILGGGPFAWLVADEVFYERPIDLSLPVCGAHINDSRMNGIVGTPVGARRLMIVGVHPTFVTAANEQSRNRWADLAHRMSTSENQDIIPVENDNTWPDH